MCFLTVEIQMTFITIKSPFVIIICRMNNEIILLHEIIINTVLKRIQNLFLPNNAWTFVVPVLLISLIQTSEKEPYTWNEHISCTAIMMALLLPVLLFVFYQEKIRKASSTRNYFYFGWLALLFT